MQFAGNAPRDPAVDLMVMMDVFGIDVERDRVLALPASGGSVTDLSLQGLLSEIGQARMALRYVHLVAHLKTRPLLTHDQIAQYNVLRGYAGDPCTNPPEGHDVNMWRKHNGCD